MINCSIQLKLFPLVLLIASSAMVYSGVPGATSSTFFGPGAAALQGGDDTQPRSFRERRKNTQDETKKKKRATLRNMSYDQLTTAYNREVANNNMASATRYLEQMVKTCDDLQEIANRMVELADIYFKNGEFKKAYALYKEFVALYKGHSKNEYALYRQILCSKTTHCGIDQDQSATQETLQLTKHFLENDHYTTYKKDVETIRDECYKLIAQNEIIIANYYRDIGNVKAAQNRFDSIRKDWLSKVPEIEELLSVSEKELQTKYAHSVSVAQVIPEDLIKKETEKENNEKKSKTDFTARF